MTKKEGEKVWDIVDDIMALEASILINGITDHKRNRMTKKVDEFAKICGINQHDHRPLWYEG